MKKRRRTIRCGDELWDEATQLAASQNTTLSELIHSWLTDYVADDQGPGAGRVQVEPKGCE